jgi:hypothetical protein
MMPRLELDAAEAVQDVLNAWGANRTSLEPQPYNADFSALFDKMMVYRNVKTIADNRREHITKEEAQREQVTKKTFLDAYRAFYAKHVNRTASREGKRGQIDRKSE